MTVTTLHPKDPEAALKPMVVETDSTKWPSANGVDANINDFHGIGALRKTGYEVSGLEVNSVYELK